MKTVLYAWLLFSVLTINVVFAENPLPPSVDASRIKPGEDFGSKERFPEPREYVKKVPEKIEKNRSEQENKKTKFILLDLNIQGNTALDPILLKKIYSPYLNESVDLSIIEKIVNEITALYKKHDYFTSLAYLPEQKISNSRGIVTIKIIESYIKTIELPKETTKYNNSILQYLRPLLNEKPLTSKTLETSLLKLNDLFGYKFKGVLAKEKGAEYGAIKLVVSATNEKSITNVTLDNYSSKLIGPHEFSFYKNLVFSPFNQISFNGTINPFDFKKLNQYSFSHDIKINPKTSINFTTSFNKTIPSPIITVIQTNSKSQNFISTLDYQPIQQRNTNLKFKFIFNFRNSNNYVLDSLSSCDKIRMVKFNTMYDVFDRRQNYHSFNFILTKGLNMFEATKKNDKLRSRALAIPNFSKMEFSYFCWRSLNKQLSLLLNIYSQYSRNSMYSSEEFGYGGQTIGRAFDNSEITGDQGMATAIEIDYNDLKEFKNYKVTPYLYYDHGIIWRQDLNKNSKAKAASIGFGFRNNIYSYINANLGFAWPLITKIKNPIYNLSNKGPRIAFKITLEYRSKDYSKKSS